MENLDEGIVAGILVVVAVRTCLKEKDLEVDMVLILTSVLSFVISSEIGTASSKLTTSVSFIELICVPLTLSLNGSALSARKSVSRVAYSEMFSFVSPSLMGTALT